MNLINESPGAAGGAAGVPEKIYTFPKVTRPGTALQLGVVGEERA